MTELNKPVRRKAQVRAPHGVSDQLVVTLYPGGLIGLREARRPSRTEQKLDLAQLYAQAVKGACVRAEIRRRQLIGDGVKPGTARKRANREEGL